MVLHLHEYPGKLNMELKLNKTDKKLRAEKAQKRLELAKLNKRLELLSKEQGTINISSNNINSEQDDSIHWQYDTPIGSDAMAHPLKVVAHEFIAQTTRQCDVTISDDGATNGLGDSDE